MRQLRPNRQQVKHQEYRGEDSRSSARKSVAQNRTCQCVKSGHLLLSSSHSIKHIRQKLLAIAKPTAKLFPDQLRFPQIHDARARRYPRDKRTTHGGRKSVREDIMMEHGVSFKSWNWSRDSVGNQAGPSHNRSRHTLHEGTASSNWL